MTQILQEFNAKNYYHQLTSRKFDLEKFVTKVIDKIGPITKDSTCRGFLEVQGDENFFRISTSSNCSISS